MAEIGGEVIPFEVKYRAQHTQASDLKGLVELCQQKTVEHGYVVTKSLDDLGEMPRLRSSSGRIMRIPAALLCFWTGKAEAMESQ